MSGTFVYLENKFKINSPKKFSEEKSNRKGTLNRKREIKRKMNPAERRLSFSLFLRSVI
jgi:hypothetical protein